MIFGIDSSLSHANNHKNSFLVLGKGPTSGINGSSNSPEKKFIVIFSKSNAKYCLNLHSNSN